MSKWSEHFVFKLKNFQDTVKSLNDSDTGTFTKMPGYNELKCIQIIRGFAFVVTFFKDF